MKTLAMQIAVTAGLAGVLALTGASLSFAQIRVLARYGAKRATRDLKRGHCVSLCQIVIALARGRSGSG